MKMLMLLEVTKAMTNELNIPWLINDDKTRIYSKSLSSRNPDIDKIFSISEDIDSDDYDENGNMLQHLGRSGRDSTRQYQNLCETVTRRVELEDSVFEYIPSYYHEGICKNYMFSGENMKSIETPIQKCVHPGFDCVQKSSTLLMTRRNWESDYWEPFTKQIASGCDCMGPVSTLGDISIHY